MATHTIQATYTALEEAATQFSELSDATLKLQATLYSTYLDLNGEWIGYGKDSFDAEMETLTWGLSDLNGRA